MDYGFYEREILTKEKPMILHIPEIIRQNICTQYLTFIPKVKKRFSYGILWLAK